MLGLKLSQIRSAYYPVVHKYINICLPRLHSSSKTIFDWLVECSTYEFLLVPDWLLYHEALFQYREKTGKCFFFTKYNIFSKASSNRWLQILTCLTIPQAWSAKMWSRLWKGSTNNGSVQKLDMTASFCLWVK